VIVTVDRGIVIVDTGGARFSFASFSFSASRSFGIPLVRVCLGFRVQGLRFGVGTV